MAIQFLLGSEAADKAAGHDLCLLIAAALLLLFIGSVLTNCLFKRR